MSTELLDREFHPPCTVQRRIAWAPVQFFRFAAWLLPMRAYHPHGKLYGKVSIWAAAGQWFWWERREGRI